MPTQLDFVTASYGRPNAGLPEARLVNFFSEPTVGTIPQTSLIGRPGLAEERTIGTGPITGQQQASGSFSGDAFAVSGAELYRNSTLIGSVTRGQIAKFAASDTQLVVITGGSAYCYDGATLAAISIPNGYSVSDVFVAGSRFYYLIQETDQWFWSALGDATSIDGLAFDYADAAPDANVGAIVVGDEAVFLGRQSVEFWGLTGDPNGPLARAQGRKYTRGCAAQGSIAAFDNGFMFVGDDRVVYRGGAVPQRVSTFGIEQRLRDCMSIALVTSAVILTTGHSFYVLSIPGQGSFAYDAATQTWAEWSSFGSTTFRGRNCINVDGVPYLGDDRSGAIWRFDPDTYTDNGDPIERLATAHIAATTYRTNCSVLELIGTRGVGLIDGTDAVAEMRWSDDQGRTWSDWRPASLGALGAYNARPLWRRLGQIKAPGRTFEVRSTTPTQTVFTTLLMN